MMKHCFMRQRRVFKIRKSILLFHNHLNISMDTSILS